MDKCKFCDTELQENNICKYAASVPEIGEVIYVNSEGIKMSRVTDVFPGLSSGNIFRDNTTHFVKVEDLPCHFFNWVYLSKEQKYFRRDH